MAASDFSESDTNLLNIAYSQLFHLWRELPTTEAQRQKFVEIEANLLAILKRVNGT